MRVYCLPIVLLCATACPGDDSMGSGDTGMATTTGTMSSTMSTTTPPSTTDPPLTSTSGSDDTMTTEYVPPTTSTTEPMTSTTTNGNDDLIWLQNDAVDNDDPMILWQAWPGIDDCWASVYDIPNDLYPFDIVALEVAIGGSGDTETFRIGIWDVAGNNEPTDEIDSAEFDIEGNVGFEPHVDLSGLNVPTIESGKFAVVMCHTGHMGAPSIATDMDGDVAANKNWVYQDVMGEWVQSPDFFGIDGDFVMRTGVRPAG